MKKTIQLGGHLRASEGFRYIAPEARALGYNVVQIMVGGDRDYDPYDMTDKTAMEYRKMMYGIETYVHLPYVINPCEVQGRRKNFYKMSFRKFAKAADQLGAKAIVLHPGFKKDLSEAEAFRNLLKFVEESFEGDLHLDLLIETDSGSKNGSAIGTAEFIQKALIDLDHPRVAMCIDTVHLFARGTNLWDDKTRKEFIDKYKGETRLVHLNSPDPEVFLGSFKDRHNTPFEERTDLKHEPMIKDMLKLGPCILERRSLGVQAQDVNYIKEMLKMES